MNLNPAVAATTEHTDPTEAEVPRGADSTACLTCQVKLPGSQSPLVPCHSVCSVVPTASSNMKATSSSVERRLTMRGNLRLASRWAILSGLVWCAIASQAQTVNLSGEITYAGRQTGPVIVTAEGSTNAPLTLPATGPFAFALAAGQTVSFTAFMDSNTNGSPDSWEATGEFPGKPVLVITNKTDVNIALSDPDLDGNGLPDWWERFWQFEPRAWSGPWKERLTLAVTNNAGSNLFNYCVRVNLDTATLIAAGRLQADGSDIRFSTNSSDPVATTLPHWVERGWNSSNTTFWIRIPLIESPATALYLYHGATNTADVSNPRQVFLLYDDFEQGQLDTNIWTASAAGVSVINDGTNGTLRLTYANTEPDKSLVRSRNTFGGSDRVLASYRVLKRATASTDYYQVGFASVIEPTSGPRFWWQNHHGNEQTIYARWGNGSFSDIPTGVQLENAWVDVEQVFGGTSYRLTLNGGGATWSKTLTNAADPSANPQPFMMTVVWDGIVELKLDWIRIRPYSDPEPEVSKVGYTIGNAGVDSDGDGLTNLQEYQRLTNPRNPDTDGDGIPDGLEVTQGLDPLNPADALADKDGDGLSNWTEFRLGSNIGLADEDRDDLNDYQELLVYHTDPTKPDTDGDGMNDGAEVAAGRDPLSIGHRYFYDRIDRLVGVEFENGLSLGYQYDGNGNLVRQSYLRRDANTNGLPDLWEFLNGLTNHPSAFADADGDGWSNYQEWKADTGPANPGSVPDALGLAGEAIGNLQLPFTPSSFVVAVGQLDGIGAEEIVIGADGNPGTSTNFLLVLTQTSSGWATNRIDVGSFGVTSVAIGQVRNRPSPAIYLGFRNPGSTGGVMEVRANGAIGWLTNTIAWSTNDMAQVLGVDTTGGVLAHMSRTNTTSNALVALAYDGAAWAAQARSLQSAARSLGSLTGHPGDPSRRLVRLLDNGGIELSGWGLSGNGLIGYWSFDRGDGTDSSGNNLTGQLLNGPTPTTGVQSGALAFDGSDDYMTVGYNPLLDVSTSLTISLWLKTDLWKQYYDLFGRNTTSGTDNIYRLWSDATQIGFYLQAGIQGGLQQVLVPAPSEGEWHHLAATWDGTTMRVFLDGVSRGSQSATGTIPTDQSALYIARKYDNTSFFAGALDEIRFYNRALSSAEVDLLHRRVDLVLVEPAATRTSNWRGSAFGFGAVGRGASSSLFYACVDDKDRNAGVSIGDDFVLAEYSFSSWTVTATNVVRLSITNPAVAQSYGLASANYLNSTNGVLFTGEPDGRVFAWTATNATGPLQRQLFSANYAGKAWHAMAGVKTLEPGQGLVGLLVDPANSNTCNVVFWPPKRELWQPLAVPQTAAIANLLPDPNSSQALATNMVQLWDAEGSPSIVELQFSGDGASWSNVPILTVDGRPNGFVSAMPTGTTHTVVWKADSLFGVGITTNIQLQARARDVSGPGNWSSPLSYSVSISAGNPIAVDDTVTVPEGVITNINVLSNDQVTNGRPKHFVGIVSPPSHGTATTNTDFTIRYQSAAYYSGPDALVYEMGDNAGGTSMAMVRITVTAINHPPEARSFSYQIDEHQPLVIQWNTDRDADGDLVNLESVVATGTAGGAVTNSGGRVTYTPAGHFTGIDTFSYTVVDNGSPPARASGTVTVTVVAVNDAPSLVLPSAGTTTEDLPLVFSMNGTNLIQVSDVDAGTQPLLVSLSCTNGSLTLSSTNGLSFTTGTNGASSMAFAGAQTALNAALTNLQYRWRSQTGGVDALTVTVNDQGNTGKGGPLSTNSVIPLTITGVNDPPVVTLTQPANGAVFYAATNISLTATASDVDGSIVKVDFLSDTTILATVTNAPYQFVWTNVATGIYRLSARATDNYDLTGTSAVAQIANSPTGFVLVSPVAGPTGLFSMSITGVIGQTYVIQKSSDLADTNGWIDVGRRTNVSGTVDYSELLTSNAPATYFRAKLGP